MHTVSLLVPLTDRTVPTVRAVLTLECAVVCGNWKMLKGFTDMLLAAMDTILIILHTIVMAEQNVLCE